MAEPVYGSSPYTAREKKVDVQESVSITGAGETKNELSDADEARADDKSESDPVLDQLNEGQKKKMPPGVYSSFIHPRLQTGTMTFDRKRKSSVPTERQAAKTPFSNGPTATKKAKFDSEKAKHKFQFI